MKQILALGLVLATLGGCTTVGGNVRMKSDPDGATVRVSNGARCVTPCTLSLTGETPLQATFSKVGYKSVTARLTPGSLGYRPNPLSIKMELAAPTIGVEAAPLAPAQ